MCPGTTLDRRREFQCNSAGPGTHTELLCTGRERGWSCGQVPIKTHLNQSYFSCLETRAIVAKHELKLSIKKEGFSYQLYLELGPGFLDPQISIVILSDRQTESREDKMLQLFQPEFHYSSPLTPLHTGILYISFYCYLSKSFLQPAKVTFSSTVSANYARSS